MKPNTLPSLFATQTWSDIAPSTTSSKIDEAESLRQGEPGTSCSVRFQKYLIDFSCPLPRSCQIDLVCGRARTWKKKRMRFCSTTRLWEVWLRMVSWKLNGGGNGWSQECTANLFSYNDIEEVKSLHDTPCFKFELRMGARYRGSTVQTSDLAARKLRANYGDKR